MARYTWGNPLVCSLEEIIRRYPGYTFKIDAHDNLMIEGEGEGSDGREIWVMFTKIAEDKWQHRESKLV